MRVFLNFLMDGTPIGLLPDVAAGDKEEEMFSRVPGEKSIELAEAAGQRAKAKGIPYGVALSEIARERPGLVESAKAEVTGVRVRVIERTGRMGHHMLSDPSIEPDEELVLMAEQRAAKKNLAFRDALLEIARESPELVRRCREAVTHTKF